MKKSWKVLSLIFILSLFTMAFCRVGQPENAIQGTESDVTLTINAAPISIDGNAELAANATAGDGSPGNPYVIENRVINASGLVGQGILINNTNAHFILRNCTVTDGIAAWGIWLENVTNGHLDNNTIKDNGGGINIRESEFNTISNNSIIGNGGYGILLFPSCYNNTLINNMVNYGTGSGISLRNSWNNTLIGNTAYDNDDCGFRLRNADENTLTANTATDNLNGFYSHEGSDWNTLTGNTANANVQGIRFEEFSNWNTLINNTANDNDGNGIYIQDSDWTNLTGNTANVNSQGIILYQSNNNTLTGNTAHNNTQHGIRLFDNCDNNTLTNNTSTSNGNWGARVASNSNGNSFYRNIIWQNKDGLPGNQILDDGGNNWVENLVNTSGDFDSDGIANKWEVDNSLNPWKADTDGDGLTDGAEILTYLTNAANPDTDGDGLTDGAEILTYLTNATNPDTDGDGLTDDAEILIYPTNATNPDTDNDLMLDGWEVQHSLNPINQLDALLDYDGDGLENVVEFVQDTDPNDWDSDGDGFSDGAELVAGTNPLDQYDFPSTPDPENILLELSILIVGIALAAALVVLGLLIRSRPVVAPPPAPKKTSKDQ